MATLLNEASPYMEYEMVGNYSTPFFTVKIST